MRLGQTSIIYLIFNVLGSIIGFLATVYFARVLGEVVLGQYALVLTVVAWLGIGGKLGFSGAITKRISEGEEQASYVGAGLVVMGATALIATLVVVIFRQQVNAYVGAPVAAFVVLLLFASIYKSFVNASLKGSHLVHVYAILSSVNQGIRALSQIGLVVLFGLGLFGMLWGYAIGFIIAATVGLWILKLRPKLPNKHHIVSLFDYAKYAWIGRMRGKTFETLDIAVLGLFVTQGLIGIYSVAWSLGKFLNIFGSAISNTLFPEMSKVSAERDARAVAGFVEDSLAYSGLILIPGIVGSAVLGDRLMAIYGEAFVAGERILIVLIVAILIYTYNKQFLNTLNAIDRPDLAFRASAIFILVNVSLNVVLVWQFGWIGAAIATALSAAVSLMFAFRYTRALVPFSIPFGAISRQCIAAISMGAIVYLVRQLIEANFGWIAEFNEILVFGLVGLGGTAYFVLLLALSATFRNTVANNLTFDVPLLGR